MALKTRAFKKYIQTEAMGNFSIFGRFNFPYKLPHHVKWYSIIILALSFLEFPSTSKAEINGRCAEICNNNRPNGSHDAFTIDCGKIYEDGTQLEKVVCSDECHYCESEVCDEDVDPFVFNCPAIDGGSKSRGWDWGVDKPGDKSLSAGVIIAIGIGCLILLGCILGCIYGCIYMSRQRQTGLHMGPNALGQYYGPPAVNEGKGESRKSHDLTNFNFVDAQGVQRTPMEYFSPSQRDLATPSVA